MKLAAYLARIGYSGPVAPDFATLDAVMRAHIATIPFENLDVQLGNRVDTALPGIFDKLVTRRRGGWCYENNGLLGWALGEIGFDVRRVSAGVMRAVRGDVSLGNHLTLIVTIDGREWLVDAGFGGTQAAPIPFAAGESDHAPFVLTLAQESDGYWRFAERFGDSDPFSFDFLPGPADEALFARQCAALQDDPESIFVQNLVVQQRQGEWHVSLRGRVLMERGADGETKRLVADAGAFVTLLRERFGLDVPGVEALWPKIVARHEVLLAESAA
ncbi:arylamine N-acetyltransferase [Sphingomonas sp. AOB5]|uniref:arylamine N-acetyltransferase family protein n=1 Tax=Sphingomonas sp. AOB5 TaxID=3034017 RepID=UPI0023F93FA0|nr:arylamine N-acetyltransferase [Sphingomonas sp. AOB5]MDF7777065.1 arylamine N-acetyltransferase [Sphingomonas sp. AOB5]